MTLKANRDPNLTPFANRNNTPTDDEVFGEGAAPWLDPGAGLYESMKPRIDTLAKFFAERPDFTAADEISQLWHNTYYANTDHSFTQAQVLANKAVINFVLFGAPISDYNHAPKPMTPEEEEEEEIAWRKAMMDCIIFENPCSEINYVDRRGGKHTSFAIATIKDAQYAREDYYNNLLKERNWLQRLLGIKPDMRVYDSIHRAIYKQKAQEYNNLPK
jgi:hypothetical protein